MATDIPVRSEGDVVVVAPEGELDAVTSPGLAEVLEGLLAADPPCRGIVIDLVPPARRASARLDWDPAVGDRRQHLAFTGVDLDARRLEDLLDSCLLAPGEEQQGFEDDPFAETLGRQ